MTTSTDSIVPGLRLVSHALCPYVQRAAIVLLEKDIPHTRIDIDLSDRPRWFNVLSPLGKTPLLLVDEDERTPGAQPLFESSVICEFLEETTLPRLHPSPPLERARHRAWMEFASTLLNDIWAFYIANDASVHAQARSRIESRLAVLESVVHGAGPWFAGAQFHIVDAAFAPVFRYFTAFEALGEPAFFGSTPRLRRWRAALAARPSVRGAVGPHFEDQLIAFLRSRESLLARNAASATA